MEALSVGQVYVGGGSLGKPVRGEYVGAGVQRRTVKARDGHARVARGVLVEAGEVDLLRGRLHHSGAVVAHRLHVGVKVDQLGTGACRTNGALRTRAAAGARLGLGDGVGLLHRGAAVGGLQREAGAVAGPAGTRQRVHAGGSVDGHGQAAHGSRSYHAVGRTRAGAVEKPLVDLEGSARAREVRARAVAGRGHGVVLVGEHAADAGRARRAVNQHLPRRTPRGRLGLRGIGAAIQSLYSPHGLTVGGGRGLRPTVQVGARVPGERTGGKVVGEAARGTGGRGRGAYEQSDHGAVAPGLPGDGGLQLSQPCVQIVPVGLERGRGRDYRVGGRVRPHRRQRSQVVGQHGQRRLRGVALSDVGPQVDGLGAQAVVQALGLIVVAYQLWLLARREPAVGLNAAQAEQRAVGWQLIAEGFKSDAAQLAAHALKVYVQVVILVSCRVILAQQSAVVQKPDFDLVVGDLQQAVAVNGSRREGGQQSAAAVKLYAPVGAGTQRPVHAVGSVVVSAG